MGFSKTFTVVRNDGENYIPFDGIYQFLKCNDQNVARIVNVRRTFEGYKGGIQVVNGQTCVPIPSVLRCICTYSESSEGMCKKYKRNRKGTFLYKVYNPQPESTTHSSFSLYKLIAKTKLLDSEFLFSKCVHDESRILTLVIDHRSLFSENEWLKICWFELHFSKSVERKFQDLEFNEVIKLTYEKFESYQFFKGCSKNGSRLPMNI